MACFCLKQSGRVSIVNQPLVCIGMPVFNGEKYLRISMESLLAQSYEDFQLIISDNASTDATEQICREYQSKDSRITYFRNTKNIGMNKNFNLTFELSKSKYFMWAAYDDFWDKTYVEKCLGKLEQNPEAVMSTCNIGFIDESGNILPDQGIVMKDTTGCDSVLQRVTNFHIFVYGFYRSEILRKTRLFTETFGGDITLGLEVLLLGDVAVVDEQLMFYRIGDKGVNDWIESLDLSVEKKREISLAPFTHLARDLLSVINYSSLDMHQKMEVKNRYPHEIARFWQHQIYNENIDYIHSNGMDTIDFIRILTN